MASDFFASPSPSAGRNPGHLPLEAVITTDELRRRPARPADHAAENAALAGLLESLVRGDSDWLQALVDRALELCRAHSAGVSLLEHEDGQPVVRCRAAAGRWSAHRGRTMPRGQSLSGLALDRGEPLLLAHPERHFAFGSAIDLPIAEALVVPFGIEGRAAGTLWVIAHDDSRHFDAEDLRLLTGLARLAALAEQVGERERLAAQLLQRSQGEQALREADLRKTEFLAMLAHELRNPLASLHNALQIVRLGGEAPEDLEARSVATAIMDRQLAHLVRLVDDLLDIGRISRGRIELRRERVDLAAVLHQAVETSGPMCKQLEQKVSVELPGQPLELDGDPARLAQVFANLLNNACKYSERGRSIRLAACVERPAAGAGTGEAVVTIKDEGIGIARDQLTRIFEMFAQVDTSIERSQGGLGLGLTLVKTVVDLHGGRVEALSDGPGRGSEFVVRLPLAARPGREPANFRGGGPAIGGQHRILVVDDNLDAADSLALLLHSAGHQTATAYGGAEALEVAESFKPNVILLDLGMPHMDGYETCRRLRALPCGQQAFLVAQTGWGHEDDRAKAKLAGFQAHLVKPVALEDLARLIEMLPPRRD